MEVSCGMFLIDHETSKLLICKYRFHETWSVPKGFSRVGEDYFYTAIRELYEDTSISYKHLTVKHALSLEAVKDDNRLLKAFIVYIDEDVDVLKLKCRRIKDEQKPVVEECMWVPLTEAVDKLGTSQIEIIKSL